MPPTMCNGNHPTKSLDLDPTPEELICVTGISGYFPDSDSVYHLGENLFNKVDLVTDDDRRWKKTNPEIPHRTGKINHIDKFDASFFDINYKMAHMMDPMSRIILEKVYECIIDAGVNPSELRNTRTGVFIGVSVSESEKTWFYEKNVLNEFGVVGCSKSMLANRISYWLGITGPSYTIDTACSSSLYALEHAVSAIRSGTCDAAIVGGSNVILHPNTSLQFARLGVLSPDGRCKSFDNRANGYARSEAISTCYLQKAKDSRRIYAQIVHAKTNCDGYKEQGITYPAGHIQKLLLQEFYDECGVSPSTLEFIEAHGTGTQVGDPEELRAIDEIFCTGRQSPLMIGSVKSNLGHSEPSSGFCALAKLCIAYNTGYIPPNINFESIREGVPALSEKRLQVVTEKTPWKRGLSGMSNFGFGGANAHVLLRNIAKNKVNKGKPTDQLPRLVCVSGRTESAVNKVFDDLESRTVDMEQIRLLHAIHERNIVRHDYRGYILLESEQSKSISLERKVHQDTYNKRPVWFMYSGLGSNWHVLTKQLMILPAFKASILESNKILENVGVNLVKLITHEKCNSQYSLLINVASQIALTDVLRKINIEPDYIIGSDVGELCCAYADGSLSAEQVLLAAYKIVQASDQLKNDILTLSIGLGSSQLKSICPAAIDVSSHISPEYCTMTGPRNIVLNFAEKLTEQNISVKEIGQFAYNSQYMTVIASALLKDLKSLISSPKRRSKRWLSTSVPQAQWDDVNEPLSSAEYHLRSLMGPVLLEESIVNINPNAIVIELGAGDLISATTESLLTKDITSVSLGAHENNLQYFLTALGRLFQAGLNPHLANIYPEVQFPVSQGTPMLAHLVEWEHSESWYVISFSSICPQTSLEKTIRFSLEDDDVDYLNGHTIDGRVIYPATGYLVLAWEMLAQMSNRNYLDVSVVFEDVYFHRATNIPKKTPVEFKIVIQNSKGNFEIVENGMSIVTGRIYEKHQVGENFREIQSVSELEDPEAKVMFRKDFYKELSLRGYQYSGNFRGVLGCNVEGTRGRLVWNNSWVTFLDTMLQVKIVANDTRSLYVPTRIEKLSIDVGVHDRILSKLDANQVKSLEFRVYPKAEVTRSGGAEIRGIHVTAISKKLPLGIPVLEKSHFVPNISRDVINFAASLRSNLQLILENVSTYKFKTIELVDEQYTTNKLKPIMEIVADILGDLPLIQPELLVFSEKPVAMPSGITVANKKVVGETNSILFVGANLLKRPKELDDGASTLKNGCFILSRETTWPGDNESSKLFDIVTVHNTGSEYLVLLRQKNRPKPTKYIKITTSDNTYSWITQLKDAIEDSQKVVIYSQNESANGMLGLINCLRKEAGGQNIYGVWIADPNAPEFKPDIKIYKEQLDKDLTVNIYKNGGWGTYRHLLLEDLETIPTAHAYVNTATIGDLSSLRWWQGSIKEDRVLKSGRHTLRVCCSALNFRDVMVAMGRVTLDAVARGRLEQECVQGIEVSGVTSNGTRVMAICQKGISNLVEVDESIVWPFPDEWNFAEAATVPVAYGTVYMALVMIGKIKRGESILIHAGSGGVGQAAISVALHYGLDVFTTVGTSAKRAFIKKLFPQLKDSHIGNSRDTSFEEMIQTETNGVGVDVVLNSLSDDKLQASAKCLKRRGRFLEIGKYDITINTQLEMCFFKKEISFHGVMLDYIHTAESEPLRRTLKSLVMSGIESGAVRPLTYTYFDKNEIEAAYRYMATGKHIGKVIIQIVNKYSDINKSTPKINAIPRYTCHEDEVYVLVGGLGGFGLELADWLILRGARKIVFSSRRGISNGYQSLRLRIWRSYGTNVQICTEDVTTEKGCEELLKMAAAMGSVKAIFNLAVVLEDAVFSNQTPETFAKSFGPKASATIYLDQLSRKYCPNLKDFVIFSSVSCGRGNAGQTNYGFSNSVMERICEERKSQGYPALAIQWGAIGDVGLVADMQENNEQLEIGGTLQQRISSCMQALDKFLKQDATIVSSIVVAEKKVAGAGTDNIMSAVAQIMGITDLRTVSQQVTLSEIGMDSIMAVEIQQVLEREFEIFLSAQEIRNLTFARLEELDAQRGSDSADCASNTTAVVHDDSPAILRVLFRNIGDESTVSQDYIEYPTKIGSKQPGEVLFMLPGLESCAAVFKPLCEKLHTKAFVMQLGLDDTNNDLHLISEKIKKIIKPRLTRGAPFYLLGYSFGCLPILEVAAQLETEGHRGVIFCLDGSPDFLQSLMGGLLGSTDDFTMQNNLINYVFSLILPKNIQLSKIIPKFTDSISFEEKIRSTIKACPVNLQYSTEYLVMLTLIVHKRLKIIANIESHKFKKIKSPIKLLRTKQTPSFVSCGENYGLNKIAENELTVHCIDADHVSIVDNDDCAKIINDAITNKSVVDPSTIQNVRNCRKTGIGLN